MIVGVWTLAVSAMAADDVVTKDLSNDQQVPNVIFLLADDLGYGELSVHGNIHISTPNIDSIAAHGVRFTDAYVTAPVCSPSRAGLLSGRYQQRFGHEFNPTAVRTDPNYDRLGLPTDQILLPRLMKDAGYVTGLVGKWHLGNAPHFWPQKRGFDQFFGFLGSQKPYAGGGDIETGPDGLGGEVNAQPGTGIRAPGGGGKPNLIYVGYKLVEEGEYLTDAFAREAVAFIDQHQRKPFFLCVAFNAVHEPLQATQQYLDRVSGIDDPREHTYAAMRIALDDAVGRILGKLEETNLTARTLVIFVSDNGGLFRVDQRNFADNTPLRAGKLFLHEGGTRVPFMMKWPGRIEAGSVYRTPVSSLDILPTAVSAARGTLPTDRPMDGVDLLPYLSGAKTGTPHDYLAWRMGRNRALRKGDWKFLQYGDNPPKLFNLADDIGESRNLSGEYPEKLTELKQLYARWESEMVAPAFVVNKPVPLDYEGERNIIDY